jgi:hypothetical protein
MTLFKNCSAKSKRTHQLNPYKVGLGLIGRRLRWDISPSSWVHKKKLKVLKGRYDGHKAVIICNGPSLNKVDLRQLEGTFTFGLNKINLLFDKSPFRPSAIVSVNPLVIEQNKDYFSTTTIPTFLDATARSLLPNLSKNTTLMHSADYPYFSKDCSISIFQGFTVTYVALQLAYHMGFTQVALVGCDHNFIIDGVPNEVTYNEEVDQNHFSENYFIPEEAWQFPDLKGSEHAYDMAKQAYESDGRMIVNATPGSKLSVFANVDLEVFLNDKF